MTLVKIIVVSLLAQSALGSVGPQTAPTSSFIARVLGIPETSAKEAPGNIDLILKGNRGVFWRIYYRIAAEPTGSLMIAVVEHKYVPKPLDYGEDKAEAAPRSRMFTEINGDICYISSRKIFTDQTDITARLERMAGDWDVLIEYVTAAAVKADHAEKLSDDRFRSYVSKFAAELKRTGLWPIGCQTRRQASRERSTLTLHVEGCPPLAGGRIGTFAKE